MKIFKHILDDVFAGLPEAPTVHQIPSARSRGFDVELVLKQKCVDKGLVAHDPWIERCKQLYNISKVHHGKGNKASQKGFESYLIIWASGQT